MSDALLTRIAEALEGLLHHAKTGAAPPAEKPAKASKAAKAVAETPTPAAQTDAPAAAATVSTVTAISNPSPAATATVPASSGDLMTAAANAVIDLANNFSRDAAVEEMAKFGAQKVSQVKAEYLASLLNNVTLRIVAEKAKKASDSLV